SVSDWTGDPIKAAVGEAATALGLKMGALMLPCRVAVTGSTAGADLIPVLSLLGKDAVLKRLESFREA
ncbi:MAG TPA: glutamate--tRNA ligase, partial [Bacteroidia bacterium]|nr:glutamate--tRNA ligase [Bacteroidia bacterium]